MQKLYARQWVGHQTRLRLDDDSRVHYHVCLVVADGLAQMEKLVPDFLLDVYTTVTQFNAEGTPVDRLEKPVTELSKDGESSGDDRSSNCLEREGFI